MAKLNTSQIKAKARELLAASPEGVRWTELARAIATASPETPPNTIQGSLHALFKDARDITKVRRGVYVLTDAPSEPGAEDTSASTVQVPLPSDNATVVSVSEDQFYASFADWLTELEEVTQAVVIGGNVLGGKWGTPDVFGVLKPRRADLIKFDVQIVSAEIKIDPSQPVVAFGQAVAYRLFSHRSFIVMPNTISAENYDRLEALAIIYGIGLVTFDLDPGKPEFSLRVRAQTVQPDMFYVNQMAKRLHDYSADMFERLF